MLTYENLKMFCDRFNQIRENPIDLSLEDKQFLQFWQTELAISILKDLGKDLGKDIANIMIFLCNAC